MKEILLEKLKNFPNSPGIYMFYSKGNIVYVGKSKNLKNRVRSYFYKNQSRSKIYIMMEFVDNIDYVLTNSHLDALVLEYNQIKNLRPLYNSQYKMDRNIYYFEIVNNKNFFEIKDSVGIGPFSSKRFIERFIKSISNIFPVIYSKGKFSFDYNILTQKLTDKDILDTFKSLNFIFSNYNNMEIFQNALNQKMIECSKNLKFETAKYYKDLIGYFDYIKILEFEKKSFYNEDYIYYADDYYYLISKGEIITARNDLSFEEFKSYSNEVLKDYKYKNISIELKNIIFNECKTNKENLYKLKD